MLIGCDDILELGRVNYFETFSSLRAYIHTWTVPRSSYPFLMWWSSLSGGQALLWWILGKVHPPWVGKLVKTG